MLKLSTAERTIVRRKLRAIVRHADDLDALIGEHLEPDDADFTAALDDLRAMIFGVHVSTRSVAITTAVTHGNLAIMCSLLDAPENTR